MLLFTFKWIETTEQKVRFIYSELSHLGVKSLDNNEARSKL